MANNDDATDGASDFETDPTAWARPLTEPKADWHGALSVIMTCIEADKNY